MSASSTSKKAGRAAATMTVAEPSFVDRVSKLGILAWSFIGFVIVFVIIIAALAAVNAVVLPMLFAVVLAIAFKPLVGIMVRHRFNPGLAAGIVVLGLLVLVIGAFVGTVRGVLDQGLQIDASSDAAINYASQYTDAIAVDQESLNSAKTAIKEAIPTLLTGVLNGMFSIFGSLVVIASGVILGSLIMYYLLKDGTNLRKSLVSKLDTQFQAGFDDFIDQISHTIRSYGKGRTIMSAVVASVVGVAAFLLGLPMVFTIVMVNFIGGYIPYIGAFLGGGLAVMVALGEGGLSLALVMLAVVLASNLILENLVQPKIMGNTLDIHPLVVLVVTALGGIGRWHRRSYIGCTSICDCRRCYTAPTIKGPG
jgi:predicted PurR-regulated permease PerM